MEVSMRMSANNTLVAETATTDMEKQQMPNVPAGYHNGIGEN